MDDKQQKLTGEFAAFIPFVESLRALKEEDWLLTLGEGKWTVRDVITHIMKWDRYFLEEGIAKLSAQQKVTIQHLDFNQFNQEAVKYAQGRSQKSILDETIHYRREIIGLLQQLSPEEFEQVHMDSDGQPFSAHHYLLGFIPHDRQHVNELNELFERQNIRLGGE